MIFFLIYVNLKKVDFFMPLRSSSQKHEGQFLRKAAVRRLKQVRKGCEHEPFFDNDWKYKKPYTDKARDQVKLFDLSVNQLIFPTPVY